MIEKIYEFQVLNAIKDGKVIYAIDFFEKRIVNLNIQEISKVFDYIRQINCICTSVWNMSC